MLGAIMPDRTHVKVLAVEPDRSGSADPWSAVPVWLAVEQRDEERVGGTVVATQLDRDGYRVGNRLSTPSDRIFDLVFFDSDGKGPLLNEARASFMVGKRVLVGFTVLSSDDELIEQRQMSGVVVNVDARRGIELRLGDESTYWLPPDVRPFQEAAPGEYRLRSTGQTILDPDYVCIWTINRPPSE
jgi:hypothetical protein